MTGTATSTATDEQERGAHEPLTLEEWLDRRRSGLGGSDMAAILGMSPWKTPVDVWLDKTGRAENTEQSERMYWGQVLEEVVAQEYSRRTGFRVRRIRQLLQHPDYPILIGNVDRGVSVHCKRGPFKPDRILECKTTSAYSASEWGDDCTDAIPDHYVPQCLHYGGLAKVGQVDVACLIGGQEYRQYEIPIEQALVDAMWEQAVEWWNKYVVTDTPPPPRSVADAEALFPQSAEIRVTASAEVEAACREYAAIAKDLKALKAKQDGLKDMICAEIGAGDTLDLPDGQVLATWKTANPRAIVNWEDLAVEYGITAEDIAEHTRAAKASRRFLCKVK